MNYKFLSLATLCAAMTLSVSAKENLARKVASLPVSSVETKATKADATPKEEIVIPAPGKELITEWEWTQAAPKPLLGDPFLNATDAKTLKFRTISPRKAPGKAKYGTMIPKDYGVNGTNNFMAMELIHGSEADSIKNIGTTGGNIVIKIDEAAGTVSIPPQRAMVHATYGNIYVYPCSVVNGQMTYNPNADVKGTIDADGKISLEGWGLFVTSGQYKGGWLFASYQSDWYPTNSSIRITNGDGSITNFNTLIEQPFDNEITIYNMTGYPNPISASMHSDKSVRITPQVVYINNMVGPFYCYSAQEVETGKYAIATDGYISAFGTDKAIRTDAWVVAARLAPTTYVQRIVHDAVISSDITLKYPAPVAGSFDGAGTQADPYKIKNATDLARLAEMVGNGNDNAGKYFQQTADINLANLSYKYSPIGDVNLPFQGNYDGNNKKIYGLNLDGLGASNVAIFGNIGDKGSVSNLLIDNISLQSHGALISPVAADNAGTIKNVTVTKATVLCNGNMTGGIAARSTGTIEDCSVSGHLMGVGSIGGIVGYNYGKIYTSHSNATLERQGHFTDLYRDVAGIAGTSASQGGYTADIADCYFSGAINEASGYGLAGGLVGRMLTGSMRRSFNTGSITHMREDESYDNYTGGLIAYVRASSIADCFNSGTIVKSSSKGLGSEAVGGLIGYIAVSYSSVGGGPMNMGDKSEFKNCFNTGQVISSSLEPHKGLWGNSYFYNGMNPIPETFTNCFFDLQATGLVGDDYGRYTADITGPSLPSGFSSEVWRASANNYPALVNLKDYKDSRLATAAMTLSDKEDVRKVKKTISLSIPENVVWKLFDDNGFTDETAALKISGNQITVKDKYSNEILAALTDDGVSVKLFRLGIVPKLFDGEGTEKDPYLVKNPTDFATLNMAVTQYGQAHIDDWFKMTQDIDFASKPDFQGVGAAAGLNAAFGGNFNGDGHTIRNLHVKAAQTDANGDLQAGTTYYNYAGLFSVLKKEGTLRNINIAADCSFLGNIAVAAIAGYSEGRIENCKNYSDIKAVNQYAAGIAGLLASTGVVSQCYNGGTVSAGFSGASGIVAYNQGLVELCQNDADITGAKVNGDLTTQSSVAGISSINNGTIDRCSNNGNISGNSQVGGLVGVNTASGNGGNITNSINTGIVLCRSEVQTRGGIIGANNTYGTLSNNYFDNSININGGVANASLAGINGMTTTDLVSGKLPEGLNATDWSVKEGAYPVLAKFAEESLAKTARTMFVYFTTGQSRANVTKDLNLSKDSGIKWSLKVNKNFTMAGGQLKVTVPTGMEVASDTLTAVSGAVTKKYFLKSVPNIFDGDGSIENPFKIETVADLDKLSEFINVTKMEYEGYNFKLMNDIDYKGDSLHIIAPINVRFMATFDGNGKTIKNYVFETSSSRNGEGRMIGMFGIVGETGHIKDLTLDGRFKANSFIGAFVGDLYGKITNCVHLGTIEATSASPGGIAGRAMEGSTISGCVNKGTVSSKGTVTGGIVATAKANSLIEDCVNEGLVTSTSVTVGGIAGETYGIIRNCKNLKTVIGAANIAGIVSIAQKSCTEISGCLNTADLACPTQNTCAGIVNKSVVNDANLLIKDCENTGNITAKGYSAGIINYVYEGVTVEGCVNKGTISNTGASYCGGIVSEAQGTSTKDRYSYIRNCHNEGKINAHYSYSGGFAGIISTNCVVEDCYNTGEVTMTPYNGAYVSAQANTIAFGGFTGCVRGYIKNSWNSGNVTTCYGTAGGFTGIAQASTAGVVMENCFNLGDVESQGLQYATNYGGPGGLVGYTVSYPEIVNCYNMGSVKGKAQLGGLIGKVNGTPVTISNSYNAGKVVIPEGNDWSNIAYNMTANTFIADNVYYDSDINPTKSDYERDGMAKTTNELLQLDLGDAYHYSHAAYPVIADVKVAALAHYHAAVTPEFWNSNDSETALTDNLYVAAHGSENWTCDDHFEIRYGIAFPVKLGEGTITLTHPDGVTKQVFKYNITKLSGVDSIDSEREVVGRTYTDLNGIQVAHPQPGVIYVVRTQYDDGTFTVAKSIYK